MGFGLPTWILVSFFRMGLEEGLEPYTFQLIQAAKQAGKELEIDEIASALTENDNRVKLSEESAKVLAAKCGKQDKDKKKNKKEKKSDKKCPHCEQQGHNKDKCYYLVKYVRPTDWKPRTGKEHLMVGNISKTKASSAHTAEQSQIREVRSFKVINTGVNGYQSFDKKENAVYTGSASDIHTLWDRAEFEEYTPSSCTRSGIDGTSLQVLGRGSGLYLAIIDGEVHPVRLTDVWHVPDMH